MWKVQKSEIHENLNTRKWPDLQYCGMITVFELYVAYHVYRRISTSAMRWAIVYRRISTAAMRWAIVYRRISTAAIRWAIHLKWKSPRISSFEMKGCFPKYDKDPLISKMTIYWQMLFNDTITERLMNFTLKIPLTLTMLSFSPENKIHYKRMHGNNTYHWLG